MTVKIDIGANTADVTRRVAEIRDAFEKLGQSGRVFTGLNFAHPELRQVADDLGAIQTRLEKIAALGTGASADAIRKLLGAAGGAGAATAAAFSGGGAEAAGITANQLEAMLHRLIRGLRTEGGPAAPGGGTRRPSRGGDAAGDDGEKTGQAAGKAVGGLVGLLGGPLGWLAGSIGLGSIGAVAGRAISQGQGEATATDSLLRRIGDVTEDFDGLRRAVRAVTEGLPLTIAQADEATLTWMRLAGRGNADESAAKGGFAAALGIGYGSDPQAFTASLAHGSVLGMDERRFAGMLGDVLNEGKMGGRTDEALGALMRWSETASRMMVTGNAVTEPEYAALYAAMNATGMPGFAGANAENVLQAANNALSQGGGAGEQGRAMLYRQFSENGITDPYQVQYLISRGAFAQIRPGGPTVLDMTMGGINRMYRGNTDQYARWDAGARMLNIAPDLYAAWEKLGSTNVNRTADYLSRNNIDPSTVRGDAFSDLSQLIQPGADLNAWRRKVEGVDGRGNSAFGITSSDVKNLDSLSGEPLRLAMAKIIASHGAELTEGQQIAKNAAEFSNALTESGSKVALAFSNLEGATGRLLEIFNNVADKLSWLSPTHATPGAPDQANPSTLYTQSQLDQLDAPGVDPEGFGRAATISQTPPTLIADLEKSHHLPPGLLAAFAQVESGGRQFDKNGKVIMSSKGAIGEMQLMPGTAKSLGVDPYDQDQNLKGGADLLELLLNENHGNIGHAAMEYNAGGDTSKWSTDYARKVFQSWNRRPTDSDLSVPGSTKNPMQVTGTVTVVHQDAAGNQFATQQLPITDGNDVQGYGGGY